MGAFVKVELKEVGRGRRLSCLEAYALPVFGVCGQTSISCRVVKGKVVEEGKWPWQVSILFLGVYVCSGSLFHEQWVLTAAHCLQRSKNESNYLVKVGTQHFSENGTQLLVTHIVIHRGFDNLASQDIALLKLQKPVAWSQQVQPVCLPSTNYRPPVGSLCWVIAWGKAGKQATQMPTLYNLHEVSVRILPNNMCNQKYQFLVKRGQQKFIGNDMLCGSLERGVKYCQSNSGSPLVCEENNTWIQVGLVSWGFSCSRSRLPSIYTSTSHFNQWIKSQVNDVNFISRAGSAFLNPIILTGYILLVSLGSLWLL
ncbi:serine protease 46-like [Tenrec ecaudatus]|uniref:serine protease 46-like n=1 Tax=Tenrec ecaudatus TaxID=94439 RepID=UPI003F598AB6